MELKTFFAQDDQGNVTSEALCYLYERGTENMVTGLLQVNGTSLQNPFTAGEHGLIQFAAANGIYDLRVVSGQRDYRIPAQFNDVSEDVEAARFAVVRAELARDAALISGRIFGTVAAGLAATEDKDYFSVESADSAEYLVLYKNVAGVDQLIDKYPNAAALAKVSSMVQTFTSGTANTEYLQIVDEEGGKVAALTAERFSTIPFDVVADGGATSIGDAEGGVVFYSDADRTLVGRLEMLNSDIPGIVVSDAEGGMLGDFSGLGQLAETIESSPLAGGELFAPLVVTSDAFEANLYPANLLMYRERVGDVVTTISGAETVLSSMGSALPLNAKRLGSTAVLNMRHSHNAAVRKFMTLKVVDVPVQTTPLSPKILLIGDSIGAYQGGYWLNQYLIALGLTPQFIGTRRGDSGPSGVGQLGEARQGWESGDYTRTLTSRALLINPGEESIYLANTAAQQLEYNPFARVATAQDSASVVRNGWVFDCAFYQSRFNLQTPDIVIQALGTNDVRSRPESSVYDTILANDNLIHNQIRATWPGAKIIRTLPGTAISNERNELWTSHYSKVIRAMKASAAARADSKLVIAPVWALVNHEGGYSVPVNTADSDGFTSSDWADPIHPIGPSRMALYRALAPYVAAAALNLI